MENSTRKLMIFVIRYLYMSLFYIHGGSQKFEINLSYVVLINEILIFGKVISNCYIYQLNCLINNV